MVNVPPVGVGGIVTMVSANPAAPVAVLVASNLNVYLRTGQCVSLPVKKNMIHSIHKYVRFNNQIRIGCGRQHYVGVGNVQIAIRNTP